MKLIFDIETDGLLDTLTKIHCIEAEDIETGKTYSFTPNNIEEGVKFLHQASQLIGHNILDFDIPAIEKVYPWFALRKAVSIESQLDTLVCSRVIWTNLFDLDMEHRRKLKKQGVNVDGLGSPGLHSLKAWGKRLGVLKGDYNEGDDEQIWEFWSQEMQEYCAQDVQVTKALYKLILSKNYDPRCLELEHGFKKWIVKQEQHGWPFDKKAAIELYGRLSQRKQELTQKLQEIFPPLEIRTPFVPKVNNKAKGYVKGVPTEKVKIVEFNPGSDKQVGERLKSKYGWKPTHFTPGGQPKVSAEILEDLHYPGIPELVEYMVITKVMGQLSEGKNAWIKKEKNGRLHGRVNTNGAVTGRCTHSVVVNVPRVVVDKATGQMIFGFDGKFGADMRSLLTVPEAGPGEEEWVLFGCDASGLELRCLGHYMGRFDGGAYADVVVNGDVHSVNCRAIGFDPKQVYTINGKSDVGRNFAKTFTYGFLYGAGDEKAGKIVGKGAQAGRELKNKFLAGLPALNKLIQAIEKKICERVGFNAKGKPILKLKKDAHLVGLDGRLIYITAKHAALNYLLQSAGSILVKKATVLFCEEMDKRFKWGEEWALVGHFHDEMQLLIRANMVEEVGELAIRCFEEAGRYFNFRCPTTGEWKTGKTWADTH